MYSEDVQMKEDFVINPSADCDFRYNPQQAQSNKNSQFQFQQPQKPCPAAFADGILPSAAIAGNFTTHYDQDESIFELTP